MNRALLLSILFILTIDLFGQTLSPKRGIAGDMLDANDLASVKGYLTWYYNWANTPQAAVIGTYQNSIEYCPMLWNGTWNAAALTTYLSAHPDVKYLLTFNEPNLTGQANMTPAAAAALWPQVVSIANTYNLQIVSPAMATYCTAGCVAGYATGATTGEKWLDDFFTICPTCRVDYIAIHVYDTFYFGFTGNVGNNVTGFKKYGKPLWVTEFDYNGGTTTAQHAGLMVEAIDFLETDPQIFRYAWFLTRSSPSGTSTDILTQATGGYTNLGLIYTNMASYDQNYYHTVNNTIEAEHYIDKSISACGWNGSICTWPGSVYLETTTDVSGILDAYNFITPAFGDTLFYNVNIPTTQAYTIDFRYKNTTASTQILVHNAAGTLLGTSAALNTTGVWTTINLAGINLASGKQKIYLTVANGSTFKLNWLKINCASSCVLPVELTSFQALALTSNSVQLLWETASEKNNKEFIIERSSDGIHFEAIGSVAGSNNSAQINHYSYKDLNVSGPLVYYRLKQIDTGGVYSYSEVKSISLEENSIILRGSHIVSHLSSGQEIYYVVVNQLGQLLGEGNYQAAAGTTEREISLEGLAAGIYFVKVISNDLSFSGKVIK
jgi:hypothetical protein